MAKISMRDLLRITHRIPSQNRFFPPPPSSFPYTTDRPISTYHPSVDLLHSCHLTRPLFQVHAQLITSGLFTFWSARLLKRYSDLGDIDSAVLVFKCIDSPGTFVVNNVIKAYSLSYVPHEGLVFYFDMVKNGFLSNSYSFVWLLGCCAKMGCVESGQKFHGQALKNGVDYVLPVQNSLIHFYGRCGVLERARKVFDEMVVRDLVSWNSIINGYVNAGDLVTAHGLFDVMVARNVVSWNVMISGYLNGNNPGCVLMLFRRMVKTGLTGNGTTIVSVFTACGRSGRLKEGRSVHGFLIKRFSSSSLFLDTSLIDMYSKCLKVEVAQTIFDRMEKINLVCWNAMILGHCIHGNPEDGLRLFDAMMHGETICPDEVTYIGLLCACARAGLLTEGKKFFDQMNCVYCVKQSFAHYWCMANLYTDAGLVQEAEDVLLSLQEEDIDVSPESLMFANLLSSCRFKSSAAVGERFAQLLINKEPENLSHYQFLVNVYAAAGQWEDVAMVKEMVKNTQRGMIPGCGLADLNRTVHNYKTSQNCSEVLNEINTMKCEMSH